MSGEAGDRREPNPVNPEPISSAACRDSAPAEYDQAYTFNRPAVTYLALRQVVRLTIFRSKLKERPVDGMDSHAAAA